MTCKTNQSINIQWRIHDTIELIKNYFYESKSNFTEKRLCKKRHLGGKKDEFYWEVYCKNV